MTADVKMIRAAVSTARGLRELARRRGLPPTVDRELAELVQRVESAADFVAQAILAADQAELKRAQPGLFGEGATEPCIQDKNRSEIGAEL